MFLINYSILNIIRYWLQIAYYYAIIMVLLYVVLNNIDFKLTIPETGTNILTCIYLSRIRYYWSIFPSNTAQPQPLNGFS